MKQRLNYFPHFPKAFEKMMDIGTLLKDSTLDPGLKHLIDFRVSQINGCLFCLDMHAKEAKLHGEKELRLYHVSIWRESSLFTPKERAALLWAETVTRINAHEVDDKTYAEVREHFSEKEIVDLTVAVGLINMWNRLGATFLSTPGSMDKMMGLDKAGL